MKKAIKFLVIHCTATPAGREVTAEDIRRMHLTPRPQGRGWRQVGYSDLIMLNGQLVNLVPYNTDNWVDPWEVTNGVSGINSVARHVVYAGGCNSKMVPADTRTALQTLTLAEYVRRMIRLHPNIKVAGHNQFDAGKACPSFNVPAWLLSIGIDRKNIY
jgi:hypothetical protein